MFSVCSLPFLRARQPLDCALSPLCALSSSCAQALCCVAASRFARRNAFFASLIAALFGFTDIAAATADVARILFYVFLEPISKSSEEDNEAGELDKAEEVLSVVLPADEYATLPLYPGEEALDEPAPLVTA